MATNTPHKRSRDEISPSGITPPFKTTKITGIAKQVGAVAAQVTNFLQRVILTFAFGPRLVSTKQAQIYICNHLGTKCNLDDVLCTYDKDAGHNSIKVSLPAKWATRAKQMKEGPHNTRAEIIGPVRLTNTNQPKTPSTRKVRQAKGVSTHPDLLGFNEKTETKDLKLALNAAENKITNAHYIGKFRKAVLITFEGEDLPAHIKPATYINQGKTLEIELTRPKALRCTNCQIHGHLAEYCPTKEVICPHCAYGHRHNECRAQFYYCVNCHNAGKHAYGHGAGSKRCPEYITYLQQLEQIHKSRQITRSLVKQEQIKTSNKTEIKPVAQEPKKAVRKLIKKNSNQGGNKYKMAAINRLTSLRKVRSWTLYAHSIGSV